LARKFRHRRPYAAIEDLVQEGNMGLLRAVDYFKPTLGCQFSTYASYWIHQALLALPVRCRPVRLPGNVRHELAVVGWTRAALEQTLYREPSTQEVGQACDFTYEKTLSLLAHTDEEAESV